MKPNHSDASAGVLWTRPRVLLFALALLTAGAGPAAAAPPGRGPEPPDGSPIDRLSAVVPALRACWRPPVGILRLERVDITARMALRVDGSLIGEPLITFVTDVVDGRGREMLTRSVLEAIRACTPLRISSGLARAIAGRPMSIRFIYVGRKGQGV